jgi:hypothetical protein
LLVFFGDRTFKAQNNASKSTSIASNSHFLRPPSQPEYLGSSIALLVFLFTLGALERHLSARWRSGRRLRI